MGLNLLLDSLSKVVILKKLNLKTETLPCGKMARRQLPKRKSAVFPPRAMVRQLDHDSFMAQRLLLHERIQRGE